MELDEKRIKRNSCTVKYNFQTTKRKRKQEQRERVRFKYLN